MIMLIQFPELGRIVSLASMHMDVTRKIRFYQLMNVTMDTH